MTRATLIGFGEAGQAFAVSEGWRAFDILPEKSRSASLAEAMEGADAVLSLVTADEALNAARQAAELITPDSYFFDMNSVAPDTKRAAAAVIDARGGRYIDVAVMSPVNPARLATPLLVSAPYGEHGAALLTQLGFTNVRVVGNEVGRASTIKMLRSVMYKGMKALTAECLIACEKAGVTDEVLGSFGNDWASGADYRLDRMMVHGVRRAAEMEEVVKTLEALGVDPLMTRGTVVRQRAIGGLGVSPVPEGLSKKLTAMSRRHCEERSDAAIQSSDHGTGLLRFARNDGSKR
jgi:3-hydroxyisobutyrate dehydrogenase-like beta-hydroxyacid dehydrogenase